MDVKREGTPNPKDLQKDWCGPKAGKRLLKAERK